MRILVSFKLEDQLAAVLVGNNVTYRPDIEVKADHELGRALRSVAPDVLVTRRLPTVDEVTSWISSHVRPQGIILIAHKDNVSIQTVLGVRVHLVPADLADGPEFAAFRLAETIHADALGEQVNALASGYATNRRDTSIPPTVAMVGAGVVNLITAYYLARAGNRVTVLDSSPEPGRNENWQTYGCTYGGNDARMFSFAESRHHLIKPNHALSQNGWEFDRPISEQGWRCCDPLTMNSKDAHWKENYQAVPPWMPEALNRDIISFNQESAPLWNELKAMEPDLFGNVGHVDGVLRLYATESQFNQGLTFEKSMGSYLHTVALDELVRDQPALKDAVNSGAIAGAIAVIGFTVNVHRFTKKLRDRLESMGVRFHWDTPVERVARNEGHLVCGLTTRDGVIKADHYVLSPGAYGNELLKGTESEDKIASVVGMWLTIPNVDCGLRNSLKITRTGFAAPGAAEGANIIIGTDRDQKPIIHVSSGHGYIGGNPKNLDRKYLDELFRVVEDTAQTYFPRSFELARQGGMIEKSFRHCVRPWTPSGLGLFELVPAENHGLLIITAGHSTGGFAQSPSVAAAVLAALRGDAHPMHRAYHPSRLASFTDNQIWEREPALA